MEYESNQVKLIMYIWYGDFWLGRSELMKLSNVGGLNICHENYDSV